MRQLTPCLWFDDNAEEAVQFYASVFPNAKIGRITRYGPAMARVAGRPEGSVMTIAFELEGQSFVALNGGPVFTFTPAISFMVEGRTQDEVDTLYEQLSAGGSQEPCGWLKDRFGVSWQIVPSGLEDVLHGADAAQSERANAALLDMKKIDLATLRKA